MGNQATSLDVPDDGKYYFKKVGKVKHSRSGEYAYMALRQWYESDQYQDIQKRMLCVKDRRTKEYKALERYEINMRKEWDRKFDTPKEWL